MFKYTGVAHYRFNKGITGIASLAACGLVATPLLAQTADEDSAAPEGTLQEVVITGMKRNQNLADVPAAVQVYNEQAIALAGISRPADFLANTPNVNFYTSRNAGDFLINIRGQTSIRGAEPSIRVIIDGVPIAEPSQFSTDLVDIQQIEILRGPQGALYGRNASAGAIVVTTKSPEDEWSGEVRLGHGNWNTSKASASFGGAMVPEKLRVRGTFLVSETDGPFTNVNTNENAYRYEQKLGRLRADWLLSDRVTLDARIEYQEGDGGSHAYRPQIATVPGLSPTGSTVGGVPITSVSTDFTDIPLVSDVPGRYDREILSSSVKLDVNWDAVTLTTITSYGNVEQVSGGKNLPYGSAADSSTDFGGWARLFGDQTQNFYDRNRQFAQEIRLTSASSDAFQWQAGIEYLKSEYIRYTNTALNGAIPADLATLVGYNGYTGNVRSLVGGGVTVPDPRVLYGIDSPYPSRTYQVFEFEGENIAPFANVQFQITDRLNIGIAGRYDIEDRNVGTTGPAGTNPFTNASYNSCVSILQWTPEQCARGIDRTFEHFQPKVTVTYQHPAIGTTYASYGVGFKTGGFNALGTRETLLRSREAVFIAQGQTPEQARTNAEATVFTNDFYDKEVSKSFELGLKSQLFDQRLSFNLAAFYTTVENSQQYRFDVGATLGVIDNIDEARIKGVELDLNASLTDTFSIFAGAGYIDNEITEFRADPALEGNYTPYVPRYNLVAGAQLLQPIAAGVDLSARVEFNRSGTTWYNLENTPNTYRSPFNLVNARVGFVGERYEVAAWARNLFNEKYASEAVVLFPYLNVITAGMTRSYGIEARMKF